jgi:hypothetical protein
MVGDCKVAAMLSKQLVQDKKRILGSNDKVCSALTGRGIEIVGGVWKRGWSSVGGGGVSSPVALCWSARGCLARAELRWRRDRLRRRSAGQKTYGAAERW